jgi:aconitate hydratase
VPAELVIDHSVQVDVFGTRDAFARNAEREFERNAERYAFLRWGQNAFERFAVVPPDTGIVHQVNLEYLARVVFVAERSTGAAARLSRHARRHRLAHDDGQRPRRARLGRRRHRGRGGDARPADVDADAAGRRLPLHGALREGATATDLVLTVTEMLRAKGVVGRSSSSSAPASPNLPLADRATIGNMSPEFGSTVRDLPDRRGDAALPALHRPPGGADRAGRGLRARAGALARRARRTPRYSDTLELDLGEVEPSIAGPRRPQDRVPLRAARERFHEALAGFVSSRNRQAAAVAVSRRSSSTTAHVVIAAITSCTNTSNPSVMVAAGLLGAQRGRARAEAKPWVKTSLAPGSRVVTEYLERAGLTEPLEALGFNLVGYGCTTCIGNSGPLPEEVSRRSPSATSRSSRCCRATATSRGASRATSR